MSHVRPRAGAAPPCWRPTSAQEFFQGKQGGLCRRRDRDAAAVPHLWLTRIDPHQRTGGRAGPLRLPAHGGEGVTGTKLHNREALPRGTELAQPGVVGPYLVGGAIGDPFRVAE